VVYSPKIAEKDALLDLLHGFDTIEQLLENEEDTLHPHWNYGLAG